MFFLHILEETKLDGEGEYNLNALKQIDVTDSYLGLDKHIRRCQNEISFDNCTSEAYIDTFVNQCGCLPFYLKISEMVISRKIVTLH